MVAMKDPILRAGSTGTAPITPAPRSRAHDRDARRAMWGMTAPVGTSPIWTEEQRLRKELWNAKPLEKSSYGDPSESFAQRKHREVWEN